MSPLYPLQAAIGAGMVIYYGAILIIVLFSIPLSAFYIKRANRLFLPDKRDKLTLKEVFITIIGTLLGFISSFVFVLMLFLLMIYALPDITFE